MSNTMDKVRSIVAEALFVDLESVSPESNLMGDLNAESIDFLDIVFRLEKAFSVKIQKGEIEAKARGNLKPEEFEIDGVLQEKGLERLRSLMPEIPASKIQKGLRVRDIPTLFTVATFERMVLEAQADGDRTDNPVRPLRVEAVAR